MARRRPVDPNNPSDTVSDVNQDGQLDEVEQRNADMNRERSGRLAAQGNTTPGAGVNGMTADEYQSRSLRPFQSYLDEPQPAGDTLYGGPSKAKIRGLFSVLDYYRPGVDEITPEVKADDYVAGPARSEIANTYADAETVGAQRDAYARMGQNAIDLRNNINQGWSPDREALFQLAAAKGGRQAAQNRDAVNRAAMSRGTARGGQAVGQRLDAMAGQNQALGMATGDINQSANDTRNRAQLAALNAIQNRAGMAQRMRSQQFGESVTRATGEDARIRRDVDYRQGRAGRVADAATQTSSNRAQNVQGTWDEKLSDALERRKFYGD